MFDHPSAFIKRTLIFMSLLNGPTLQKKHEVDCPRQKSQLRSFQEINTLIVILLNRSKFVFAHSSTVIMIYLVSLDSMSIGILGQEYGIRYLYFLDNFLLEVGKATRNRPVCKQSAKKKRDVFTRCHQICC